MTEEVKQEAQETVEENAAPVQPSQQGPDLNISDLAAMKNIIDVASQRGAFKAPELELVGKTYNKLALFLDSVNKREQP
jgi:hypothetical protein